MAKMECLYSVDLKSERKFSPSSTPDVRGMGYLLQLKQILEADQNNIIKEADVDSFLQSFQGDVEKLKHFLESFHKFKIVMEGKVFIELEKLNSNIASKTENQYSCSQLAKILDVDRVSVNKWVNAGFFPNILHRGNKNMIIESDITNFVKTEGSKYLRQWQKHMAT